MESLPKRAREIAEFGKDIAGRAVSAFGVVRSNNEMQEDLPTPTSDLSRRVALISERAISSQMAKHSVNNLVEIGFIDEDSVVSVQTITDDPHKNMESEKSRVAGAFIIRALMNKFVQMKVKPRQGMFLASNNGIDLIESLAEKDDGNMRHILVGSERMISHNLADSFIGHQGKMWSELAHGGSLLAIVPESNPKDVRWVVGEKISLSG